jgi:hypothetical protein
VVYAPKLRTSRLWLLCQWSTASKPADYVFVRRGAVVCRRRKLDRGADHFGFQVQGEHIGEAKAYGWRTAAWC